MNIEGRLSIDLFAGMQRVDRVEVRSSRPLQATRIFEGKSPRETLEILPVLYNICGVAQAHAAMLACQNAQGLGRTDDNRKTIARDMLVWVETAREHVWRILSDWPEFAGEESDESTMKPMMQLLHLFTQALFVDGQAFSEKTALNNDLKLLPSLIEDLENILRQLIFACSTAQWLTITDSVALNEWIEQGETVASRLLRQLKVNGWEKLGVTTVGSLPVLDEQALLRQFSASNADSFVAEPLWKENVYETTSLTRQGNNVLVDSVKQEYQNGLMSRLVSRLVELAMIPEQLKQMLEKILTANLHGNKEPASDNGVGIGQVEAARGRLIHYVELKDGIFQRYQILAPTEWNFHPQGVVAQGLKGLCTKNEMALHRQATMLISAVDPCVGYELTVH